MRQFIAKVRRPLRPALTRCVARWRALSHYWQHFLVAVVLGICIELLIHAAHDFSAIKRVQNWVLDTSINVFSLREKADSSQQPMPILLVEDDLAVQSSKWGSGKAMSLDNALLLASAAFDRGASHVFLDITFDGGQELNAQDQASLRTFADKYAKKGSQGARHLYVARSAIADPCLPRQESLERLRPSVWDHLPALDVNNRQGLVIHSVLPHYRADADHVVRGWDLFAVLSAGREGQRQFLPSPQLAYASVRQASSDSWKGLPWLNPPKATHQTADRSTFAELQVRDVPLLNDSKFTQQLCGHHGQVLGCPSKGSHHGGETHGLEPRALLSRTNELLRPLPMEHSCRERVTELLQAGGVPSAADQAPQDLLFNRIVFELPSWERAHSLAERGYYIRTPLTLGETSDLDWSNRLVAIGAAHASSADWHATPIGRVPGVLINLNAMQSLERIGPIASPPSYATFLVNVLIIVTVAAIFSALSPLVAAAASAGLLLGSMALFHQYLLSRGIWIEFGAPLVGINLHRIIDGYLAYRRLKAGAGKGGAHHE